MTAQSVASRSRPPRHNDSEDVVMARAVEFTNWARTNIRLIVVAAVVLAVALSGLVYYRSWRASQIERAATAFMQLEQTVGAGNPALAAQELQRYVATYAGTDYASEARLVLARLQLQQGQAAQAIETLQPLASEVDTPMGAQAGLLLGAAQQAAGQTEQAIQTYLRVADQAELGFVQTEALSAAALLRMQGNDFAGAAELYARLVELADENSVERALFEMRRAEAEARAASGAR